MSQATRNKYRPWCSKCLDFHSHFAHPEVFDLAEAHAISSDFGVKPLDRNGIGYKKLTDPREQISDMNSRGIDVAVISSCDVIQSRSWAEPIEEDRMTRLVNDMALTWVGEFPERFIGSFVIPLGDEKLMLQELRRCLDQGLRIVNLPSNYRGNYLGEPRFDALWEVLNGERVVSFIHPDGVRDPWFIDYAMWNSIGQSIEEVRVMTSLIYSGNRDRYPHAQIVMAHGGGYMPHYMGRLDRNVSDKPYTARNLKKKPSDYLKDFYYDSCVYDPRTLELLGERVGFDRIVLGGDYPVAAIDPVDFLEATRLSDEQKAGIAGANATRLLNLETK